MEAQVGYVTFLTQLSRWPGWGLSSGFSDFEAETLSSLTDTVSFSGASWRLDI